ncbi:SNF2 family N-terminal domain-containing protein [Melampsora americana]|nr:SNF2 family N-terminal domain-containing protein [Melampsora americana]
MSEGFMVYSGAKLEENEQIKLVRSRPSSNSKSEVNSNRTKVFKTNQTKPDYVVRVESQKNGHFARLNERFGQWIVPLIDLNLCQFEGNLVFPPENPRSGDTVQFYIKVYITRDAFGPPDQLSIQLGTHQSEKSHKPSNPRSFVKPYKSDNPEDQIKINRQQSLIKLFETIDLKPIQQIKTNSFNLLKSKPTKALKVLSSEDGSTISDSQLKSVYHQANLKLESIHPPNESKTLDDQFKLKLRSYQEKGLNWLLTMETLSEETNSIHPLWDQYTFPKEEGTTEALEALEPFYYNSYMGCFTLQFPHSARKSRGGILADEMGLGKTIQMAALICTGKPSKEGSRSKVLDSNVMKEDEIIEIKHPKGLMKPEPMATLVICPLTLLNQWQDELERCDPSLKVSIYHSSSHGKHTPEDPTQGGSYDVVITTYGIVATEWAELDEKGIFDTNKKKKSIARGLFSIEWHRVILDEAHTIKNRNARTTKACYELKSLRRWCLTGTPIVNRLEDLASLLHFVKLEPWGDFSFFKSFVTIPFSKGDPKAVEVVQVIIESVVLRREKSMKDRQGKLIVGDLPPKTIEIKSLKMNEKESKIYEMMFKNAKAKFLEVLMAGTVMKNFTMILTILIRLRQIVLHPSIVIRKVGEEFFHQLIRNVQEKEKEEGEEESLLKSLIKEYGQNDWNETGSDLKKKMKQVEKVLKKKSEDEDEIEECSICLDFIDSRVFLPCMHSFCKECIMEYVESKMGEETRCANCNQVFVETDLIEYVGTKQRPKKMICPSSSGTSEASTQGDEEMQVDELIRDRDQDEDQEEGVIGYFKTNHRFISSTKLEALVEDLIEVRRSEPEFSAVVFSQFNDFLNLLEKVLKRDHFRYAESFGRCFSLSVFFLLNLLKYPKAHLMNRCETF